MKITIQRRGAFEIINTEDIVYFFAQGSYTTIRKANGESITASRNLSSLIKNLNINEQFVRCHRSYIVHLKFVNVVQTIAPSKYKILLQNGEIIPLSSSLRSKFIRLIKEQA